MGSIKKFRKKTFLGQNRLPFIGLKRVYFWGEFPYKSGKIKLDDLLVLLRTSSWFKWFHLRLQSWWGLLKCQSEGGTVFQVWRHSHFHIFPFSHFPIFTFSHFHIFRFSHFHKQHQMITTSKKGGEGGVDPFGVIRNG